jgi:tryptophan halogenase
MRVAIIGGGTAGWLAALMITKAQADSHDVVVIESSKIGIVGAGEGSTGYLTDIIQGNNWDYGCDEGDFFRETNATVKLGIRHRDWRGLGHDYIAPIDGSLSNSVGTDYLLCHALINDIPFHTASLDGQMIERSLSSFYYQEDSDSLINMHSHAYHFDAHKVGQYFRKVCGESITHIDSEVEDISVDERGFVQSVTLSNGRVIEADFFIDCTGFARLFAKKLGIGWKSYRDHLPVNTAMPFLLPHKESERIDPVTIAWAQKAGWMWMIPTQDRWGCGYVFDDSFVSHGDALAEVEKTLGVEIEPLRVFGFETGRLEQVWFKNCLFAGLSAAFAEPLEATSIHSTIIQLNAFVFQYLRDSQEETCNEASVAIYNRVMTNMYDDFKDFLNIHYMGQRNDSEFWRWIATGETMTESSRLIIELQKARLLRPNDIAQYTGHAGASLYNWILAGLGYLGKKEAARDLAFFNQEDLAFTVWEVNKSNFESTSARMVDNTEFIHNIGNFEYGYCISK